MTACTWLKLCAWSVFGGIFWTCAVCVCAHTHTHSTVHNMPPNTDHAHNKHIRNIIRNFNQLQAVTPWWWILCDPKHVGVIFNVCLLDLYTAQILTSRTVSIECISWSIKVTIHFTTSLRPFHVRADWNSARSCSNLPWVGVKTFQLQSLRSVLGVYKPYLNKVLEILSFGLQTCDTSDRLLVGREIYWGYANRWEAYIESCDVKYCPSITA